MAANMRFSDEQIRQFREEGYVVEPQVFGRDDLARADQVIRELTDAAMASGDHGSVLELEPEPFEGRRVPRRIYNPFHQHQVFADLAKDPRMLDRVEQLFGPNIALQHSKLNMKPARVGSVVEWHQDLSYFPHTNDDLLAALIYVDGATRENGCLQVLPRQHRGYLNHDNSEGTFAGMITEDLSDGSRGTPVPLPAPAGSVIFMHCLVPHSSLPNQSDSPRRTLIFEYRAADSFALDFGDQVTISKVPEELLRGKPARFARLGTIAPMIPRFPEPVSSLYELQAKTTRSQKTAGLPDS